MSDEHPVAVAVPAEANASAVNKSDASVDTSSDDTPQQKIIGLLRQRAQRLTHTGWMVLGIILAVIVLGSAAFWLSGQRSELAALAEQGDRLEIGLDALTSMEQLYMQHYRNNFAPSALLTNNRMLEELEINGAETDPIVISGVVRGCKYALLESNFALANTDSGAATAFPPQDR